MFKNLIGSFQGRAALVIFSSYTLWWVILQFITRNNNSYFDYFASTYCILAIWGGIWGFIYSKKWGGIKSIMGKAMLFFSLGLFMQAFGQLIYSYYIVVSHIDVPYPSVGDIGYFGSIPLYILGILFLAQASGVKFSLKSIQHKLQGIAVPVAMLVFSYFIFLQGYEFGWSKPLTIFLDFGYPFGQAIYVSLALLTYLLSRNMLGGVMKGRILVLLVALFIQYLSDFTFLYQANNESYVAAGIADFLYLISYFVMTFALLGLNTQSIKKYLD